MIATGTATPMRSPSRARTVDEFESTPADRRYSPANHGYP